MIQYPVKNPIVTSPYGPRTLNGKEEMHDGIDFISRESASVYSITKGLVCFDKDDYDDLKRWDTDMKNSGGNMIIMSHSINGIMYFCRYLHLKNNIISKGDILSAGDIIGEYADVGYSFGAHLHFDCYDSNWKKVDPTFIFNGIKS